MKEMELRSAAEAPPGDAVQDALAAAGLMAPLADLSGVTRQTAVLAFQLGDGLTNVVVPTSGALMGCLAAARLDFTRWIAFFWRPMALLFALSSVFVLSAHAMGFS
jgi:uncharacterized ion transporter superfamily protein YfcC